MRFFTPPATIVAITLAVLTGLRSDRCEAEDDLRNWFKDPFFQVSAEVADCPLPAGPFVTEIERRLQSHRRAEKGTTCWLAHECDRPNAYAYDQDIAAALQAAWRDRADFVQTSLWVTVQGRVVYFEGCVATADQAADLEAFARAIAHVQQAMAIVWIGRSGQPPYRLRVDPTGRP